MVRCGHGSEDRGRVGDSQLGQKWKQMGENQFSRTIPFEKVKSLEGQADERATEEVPTP